MRRKKRRAASGHHRLLFRPQRLDQIGWSNERRVRLPSATVLPVYHYAAESDKTAAAIATWWGARRAMADACSKLSR